MHTSHLIGIAWNGKSEHHNDTLHVFYYSVSVHLPLLWWRPGYLNDIHGWYGRLDNKTPFVKPRGGHAAIGGIDLPASQAEEAPEEELRDSEESKGFLRSYNSPLQLSSAIRK